MMYVLTFHYSSMEEIRLHLLSKGLSWDGSEVEVEVEVDVGCTQGSTCKDDCEYKGDSEVLIDSTLSVEMISSNSTSTSNCSDLIIPSSSISLSIPIITATTTTNTGTLKITDTTLPSRTSLKLSPHGTPPLFVMNGVFDSNPLVEKVTRHAAKFVTAEEEAECRKLEISALKNRYTAGVLDKNDEEQEQEQNTDIEDVLSLTDNTVSGLNSVGGVSIGISINGNIFNDSEKRKENNETDKDISLSTFYNNGDIISGVNPFTNSLRLIVPNNSESDKNSQSMTYCNSPLTRGNSSRNPVLSSVNPDLINCLNKMFSPQNSKYSRPNSSRDLPVCISPRSSVTDGSTWNSTSNIDISDEGLKFEQPSSPSRSDLGLARLGFLHKAGPGCSKPTSPVQQLPFKGCRSKLLQVSYILFAFCHPFKYPLFSLSVSLSLSFSHSLSVSLPLCVFFSQHLFHSIF